MKIYEKVVSGVKKVFGTLSNISSDSDVEVTYKVDGEAATLNKSETYKSSHGKIIRASDLKEFDVYIGDTRVIPESTTENAVEEDDE